MSWGISEVSHSRKNIYRVTAEERDIQGELTGNIVSMEYNENTDFPALQTKLLNAISEKQQIASDKKTKLETYQANVSLISAKIIEGVL